VSARQRLCRNLLFITADQLRADVLLSKRSAATPNLDRLARRGLSFSRHFAQCAPCGPSRASLHTSAYMHVHGSRRNGVSMRDGTRSWATEARARGFDPVLIGFTHTATPYGRPAAGGDGREPFEGLLPGLRLHQDFRADMSDWYDWVPSELRERCKEPRRLISPEHTESHWVGPIFGRALHSTRESDLGFLIDKTIQFIESQRHRSWVLHLSLFRPHDPYLVSADSELSPPSPWAAAWKSPEEVDQSVWNRFGNYLKRLGEGRDRFSSVRHHYETIVGELDAHLGRLFDAIEAIHQLEDTAVLLTSDHGDQLGDYGLFGKGGPWQQSFHVPLILVAPGIGDGGTTRVVDELTESIDVAPTILELLGCEAPSEFQGDSLCCFFDGSRDWREYAHWEYEMSGADAGGYVKAARSEHYMAAMTNGGECALFAIGADGVPIMKDLASQRDLAHEAQALRLHLSTWGAARSAGSSAGS
jgi:arylsulfatase A-like enzyme